MAVSVSLDSVPVVLVPVMSRRPATGDRSTPGKFEHRDDQKHHEDGEKQDGVIQRDSRFLLPWWIRLCLVIQIRTAIDEALAWPCSGPGVGQGNTKIGVGTQPMFIVSTRYRPPSPPSVLGRRHRRARHRRPRPTPRHEPDTTRADRSWATRCRCRVIWCSNNSRDGFHRKWSACRDLQLQGLACPSAWPPLLRGPNDPSPSTQQRFLCCGSSSDTIRTYDHTMRGHLRGEAP